MKEPEVNLKTALEQGLTEDEYQRILKLLGRVPTFTELGIFALMWSEHCSYKSSRALLKQFPTKGERVIQGPGENAGVVDIGDGLAVVFKIESHNHPSFIEPYHGAATGVGGILRDVFTMGARPIASLNSLRFGSVDHPKTRWLVEGVVAGIGDYGNCVGVPTVGGEVYFHPSYNGNILVNAFTLGIVPRDRIFRGRASGVGNPVFYVGSKTGRDGIHGAGLLASAEFDETSEEKRPTVQAGDPFMEKLLLEACLELMQTGCLVGIQDMGAAGLSSSSFEMAGRGGTGILMELSRVPCREPGMTPYELMLSESQERMLLIATKGAEEKVKRIFKKWDLEAVVIGEVTDDGMVTVLKDGNIAAQLPAEPLSTSAPFYHRPMQKPGYLKDIARFKPASVPIPSDMNEVLKSLLSSPNIASKEWVYRQYDYTVRDNTVLLPGSDAAVIRIKGTNKALGLTVDGNSRYCYLHPQRGGMLVVAEAARNLSCCGATPLAMTDCLNFGNPEKPEIMWQFDQCIKGMSQACQVLGIPVVSGNVSFYNETFGSPIYPTPTVGMVGLLDDCRKHSAQLFKEEGDIILLLGETNDELGGSEYLSAVHKLEKGEPPTLDLSLEKGVQETCRELIRRGLVHSAHDCSEGGLAVALAECCFHTQRSVGASVELKSSSIREDAFLFGEAQSRILVSVPRQRMKETERLLDKSSIPWEVIGRVGGEALRVTCEGEVLIDHPIRELYHLWSTALERLLFSKEGE
ncbi:MAG: phosphoribosylformylglycinamidine synthase subunit PurL [Acidobacteriota bacterium]